MERVKRKPQRRKSNVVAEVDLSNAQKVFVRYVSELHLEVRVLAFRNIFDIDKFGFDRKERYFDWLLRYRKNLEEYRIFRTTLFLFMLNTGLPFSFRDLFHDYVISGFRFNTIHKCDENIFCSLEKPIKYSKSEVDYPYYVLHIHEGASIKDISRYIKEKETEIEEMLGDQSITSTRKRRRNFKNHSRDTLVKIAKNMTPMELLKELGKHRLPPNKHPKKDLVEMMLLEYGIFIDDEAIKKIK